MQISPDAQSALDLHWKTSGGAQLQSDEEADVQVAGASSVVPPLGTHVRGDVQSAVFVQASKLRPVRRDVWGRSERARKKRGEEGESWSGGSVWMEWKGWR